MMRVDWCGCGSCEQVARVGMMLSARNCVADALQRCRGRTSLVCVRENLLYIASVTDFFLADTRRWMEAVLPSWVVTMYTYQRTMTIRSVETASSHAQA